MKKIGIITFHRAINYGAVFQTYALMKKINELGADGEVIDYVGNRISKAYNIYIHQPLKRKIINTIYLPIKAPKKHKFERFINKNIKLSKRAYKGYEELKLVKDEYDQLITGSDQVWNNRHTGMDKGYFLYNIGDKNKRNSYAASLGFNEIPQEYIEQYKEYLSGINNISVRENSAQIIINNLGIDNCSVNIDPTFLISKDHWISLSKKKKHRKPYILLFVMQKNSKIFEFTEQLAKEKGLDIIYISDSYKNRIKGKYIYTAAPEEWISYINNAKYVVTNSFHGLAFSIILNKNVYVGLQKEPATGNDRLLQLIEMFGINDKVIDYNVDTGKYTVDWNRVNEVIASETKKSEDYLLKIIKE